MRTDYIDLCTLRLISAEDKSPAITLRVEMRDEIRRAGSGNAYRSLRVSDITRPPSAGHEYEWGVAFASAGDQSADGSRDLVLKMKVGDGPVTQAYPKQEIRLAVRRGQAYEVAIATAMPEPAPRPQPTPEPQAPPGAQRQESAERARQAFEGVFEGFFSHLGEPKAGPDPRGGAIWAEIEAVLRRKRYTSIEDVRRTRKAMALLLHSDRADARAEMDALSRANAFLDERERPFKPVQV